MAPVFFLTNSYGSRNRDWGKLVCFKHDSGRLTLIPTMVYIT